MSKKSFSSQKMIIIIIIFLFISALIEGKEVRNIIFMVPDGMGISNVTATRIYAYGTGNKHLYFETLEQIGYQSTHSANSMVTDSAAAASAWACGEKFNNGEISYHRETRISPKTILELAQEKGKKIGLVATSTITHATPAAFAAHVESRRNECEIARQFIVRTMLDVLLGGGKSVFQSSDINENTSNLKKNLIKIAMEKGYTLVYTREDLQKSVLKEKLLGLFRPASLTPAYQKKMAYNAPTEPTLTEMSQTALKILERGKNGFFLLIEGSQIDWANHHNNLEYLINEILEFDRAVKVVLDWVDQEKSRKEDTLIIIVPDHDCGGFAIKGPEKETMESPGQYVKVGWISGNHTGEDTMIWSQGPYSEHLGKAIDNTDIFHIMKAALEGKEYNKTNPFPYNKKE